jgi:hypothetical protein
LTRLTWFQIVQAIGTAPQSRECGSSFLPFLRDQEVVSSQQVEKRTQ